MYQLLVRLARLPRYGRQEVGGESWILGAPQSQILKECRKPINTARRLIRSLTDKLALELVREAQRDGRPTLYRVFSQKKILERRRAAGMVWVVRTRGVEFISEAKLRELIEADELGVDEVGPPGYLDFDELGGAQLAGGSPPNLNGMGGPTTSRRIEVLETQDFRHLNPATTATVSASDVVTSVLRKYLVIDDEAVRKVIANCRAIVPDATDEEIAHFAEITAYRAVNIRSIDNPVGLVIRQVAKHFEGTPFKQFREEQKRKQLQRDETERKEHADAERILADPKSSAEDIAWAHSLLGRNG